MSGIAGAVGLRDDQQIATAMVERMAAAVAHRGPDGEGLFEQPGVSLALRFSAIVDPDRTQGPLASENGHIVVAFDGAIFNYDELRRPLEAQGRRFQSQVDAELFAQLWDHHGTAMLPMVSGQFAAVVFDVRQNTLYLVRDRAGTTPLFWARRGDTVYFGSEVKAILASGEVPAAADPRGLDHIFTYLGSGTKRTPFRDIWSVSPASFVAISRRGHASDIQETSWWDLSFPTHGNERCVKDERELVEEFGWKFQYAVQQRLRSDVPVASYLSGGVDSGTVMTAAKEVSGQTPPGFTLQITDKKFDETHLALQIADRLGRRPTVVRCSGDDVANTYPALVTACEVPVANTACAALYLLAAEVQRQQHKVVLTGEGSDDVLAGYPWLKASRLMGLADGVLPRASNFIRRGLMLSVRTEASWQQVAATQQMLGGPNGFHDLFLLISQTRHRFYSRSMWEQLAGHTAYDDLNLPTAEMARWHPLNRGIYLGYKTFLPGLLLSQKDDRTAMRHGVQPRYPFLDDQFVAFLNELHPKYKMRGLKQDKWLLRQYAARSLPKEIAQRPKELFKAPLDKGFFQNSPRFVDQLLSDESLQATGYFDLAAVKQCRVQTASKWSPLSNTITELGLAGVLATQLWHHLFLGGGLCELPAWQPSTTESVAH